MTDREQHVERLREAGRKVDALLAELEAIKAQEASLQAQREALQEELGVVRDERWKAVEAAQQAGISNAEIAREAHLQRSALYKKIDKDRSGHW